MENAKTTDDVPQPRPPRGPADVRFRAGRLWLLLGVGLLMASLAWAIGSRRPPGALPDLVPGLLAGAGGACLALALVARFIGFLMGPWPGDLPERSPARPGVRILPGAGGIE